MAEILIHLPLFRVDVEDKFWCEILYSLVKYNYRASFLTFPKWYRDETLIHVVNNTRNAYAKFVRSGVK